MAGSRGFGVLVAYLVLALTWGSSFFFIKISLAGLPPQQLVLGRLVLGAITLNVILLLTRKRWPKDRALIGHLAVVAFLLCVLPLLLFAWVSTSRPACRASTTPRRR